MKLFCFTYRVYPVGDFGGSLIPREKCTIVAAENRREAEEFLPQEMRGTVEAVSETEIKPGILFR